MKAEVLKDLKEFKDDSNKLRERYAEVLKTEKAKYGNDIGNIPMNKDEPYHVTQQKLLILNSMFGK